MARRDQLLWLTAGGIAAAGSLPFDDQVLRTFAADRQPAVVAVGEHLGEAGLHFGAAFALYVGGRAANHTAAADLGVVLLRTQVVNGIFTRGLKLLPRPRPYQETARPARGAFPSGHTSASFATATVLHRRWGWRAGVPAYAVAAFIGGTRLHKVHHLSDVAFGAALGIASGLSVTLPGSHAVAPLIAPGVAGVSVTIGGDRDR